MKYKLFLLLTLALVGCGTMLELAHQVVPSDNPEDAAGGALGEAAKGNFVGAALYAAAGLVIVLGGGAAARKVAQMRAAKKAA